MTALSAIDAYIAAYPTKVQTRLRQMRRAIHAAAPGAEEAIRYGIPTFRQHGNLVHFGAFKNHIGFFPTPSGIAAFRKQLAGYAVSKGAVQFLHTVPLPISLIKEMVRFRVAEQKKRIRRV